MDKSPEIQNTIRQIQQKGDGHMRLYDLFVLFVLFVTPEESVGQ